MADGGGEGVNTEGGLLQNPTSKRGISARRVITAGELIRAFMVC